jgi:hypothetical protein
MSIWGLCTHDEIIERSDEDHHDELDRCPLGDTGEDWLSKAEDMDGTAESARDRKIFFIHLTISSES